VKSVVRQTGLPGRKQHKRITESTSNVKFLHSATMRKLL